ncbi:BEN domain-containing protein 2-like [Hoplias malabaricus]|uniref:BEN domain-containing protein 2-like n=1 Tax=Hoplias malabaricus TaxID=27720 RepID=UPI0034620715
MTDLESEALLDDAMCVDMENGSAEEEEVVASTDIFGDDPLRTLGEILAYCQVMYGAIQKLDEKLEMLQIRVTHIQTDHTAPKVKVHTPRRKKSSQVKSEVADVSNFLMQQNLTSTASPLPPPPPLTCANENVKAPGPPLCQEDTENHVSFSPPASPSISPALSTHTPPQSPKKMLLKHQGKKTGHKNGSTSKNTGKFVLPRSFLRKASIMSSPTVAARFLLRNVFTHNELLQENIRGNAVRGLSKLGRNKISAIREWLQKRYPKHDLREKGKDWKACVAVMNKGARHIRLMDKRCKPGSTDPDSEEQPLPVSPVESLDPTDALDLKDTVEISKELSDREDDMLQNLELPNLSIKLESDQERSSSNGDFLDQEDLVFLGCPERQVKVPPAAIYTASHRPSAPLAARHLIKFIFTEDVLVRSNVYGSAEYGMEPLDPNKISALREHLCERFPELDLDEEGYDWKTCVDAINSSIRKTRHKCKKYRR